MLLRRHRASLPDVDPAFNKTPHETVDPAFTDPDLTNAKAGEQVSGAPGSTVENLFDPNLHNTEKVLEHAASLDADELAALIQAETAGKSRKGVLEALAKFSAEKEQEGDPSTPGDTEAPDPGEDPSKDGEELF